MRLRGIIFSIYGFLSVALGAFAAHGLQNVLDEHHLEIFRTGVAYQFYHTLALGLTLVLSENATSRALAIASWFFIAGIAVFSGSLYSLALTGIGSFGAVTPIGGLCFLIGWGFMFRFFLMRKTHQ